MSRWTDAHYRELMLAAMGAELFLLLLLVLKEYAR
jgi:hypothetical protein